MTGLLLLGLFVVFVRILIVVSKWLTCRLKWSPAAVFFTRLAIVIGAFPLMLADEMIGAIQYEYLCKRYGISSADLSKAKGKKVMVNWTEGGLVPHTALPIREDFISLTDAQTKEILATFRAYGTSGGGWLTTYTWVGINGSSPMFINSECFYYQKEYVRNQISVVE